MSFSDLFTRTNFFWLLFLLFTIELFSVLPNRQTPSSNSPFFYRQGVFHVHSSFSHDGGGSIPEIAASAKENGLDFVILTDHDNVDARRSGFEKAYDAVDVFVETESSLPMGHAVAMYSHTDAAKLSDKEVKRRAQQQILGNNPIHKDAFQIVAHPTNQKRPWDRLELLSLGIEIVNLDSVWRQHLADSIPYTLTTALLYPLNHYLAVLRFLQVHDKNLEIWDHMNSVSKGHFGILAHDTHSKTPITKSIHTRWPHYQETFKFASNVVLLKDPPAKSFTERRLQLYDNLKQGRMATVFHSMHPFEGNDWWVNCVDKDLRSGERIKLASDCLTTLSVPESFPYPTTLKMIKNGKVIAQGPGPKLTTKISEPGVYRAEVWANPKSLFSILLRRPVPYVLYNPIYFD